MSNWRNRSSHNLEQPHSRGRGWRGRGKPIVGDPQIHADSSRSRQMEHIASVSRSSGLERDGDTLKDFKVQEEYRDFLQGKVDDLFKKYPRTSTESNSVARQRVDAQENVLILFRKLREGVSSSQRKDSFALEAYETSLYLSVAFNSTKQTTSIIPHLLPDLYLGVSSPHYNRLATIMISLVHHLVTTYPSQSLFQQHLDSIPSSLLAKNSNVAKWIDSLARSLRARNFIKLEELTGSLTINNLLEDPLPPSSSPERVNVPRRDLPRLALHEIIDSLRIKARNTSWEIIRSAYREISSTSETGEWLSRSLCLKPLRPYATALEAEQWFNQQSPLGHVRPKEGVVDKWIICRVR